MWLIAPTVGFYSIVRKPWDVERDTLTIRARVRQDLVNLKNRYIPDLSDIVEDPRADYLCRATASRLSVASAMAAITADIDYDNVKDRAAEVHGDQRAAIYLAAWSALRRLQDKPVRSAVPVIYAGIGRRPDILGPDDDENGSNGL
jgi:hypothetical protein